MYELNSHGRHGLGRKVHEHLTIPNFFDRRFGEPLTEGLVITIEPVISAGSPWTVTSGDGWTTGAADGGYCAHHEHTVVVTKGRPIILTAP